MFNSQILDTAIGLAFIYFFLSLLCSVIIESVTGLTKKRPRMLRDGIAKLLQDPGILSELYRQPLFMGKNPPPDGAWKSVKGSFKPIFSEKKKKDTGDEKEVFPSYISSRTFVLSLLESLKKLPDIDKALKKDDQPPPELKGPEDILKLVKCLPENSAIRRALVPLVESAGNDMDKALDNIAKWYDEAMERVTGWYKRYSQAFALILGFVVALALNADTFDMTKTIYRDPAIRASLVVLAEQDAARPPSGVQKGRAAQTRGPAAAPNAGEPNPPQKAAKAAPPNEPKKVVPDKDAAPSPAAVQPAAEKQPDKPTVGKDEFAKKVDELKDHYDALSSTNLPLGWPSKRDGQCYLDTVLGLKGGDNEQARPGPGEQGACKLFQTTRWDVVLAIVVKLLGIALTALMVSLGSNFWFELINKLLNMRNAGKKPLTRLEQEARKA